MPTGNNGGGFLPVRFQYGSRKSGRCRRGKIGAERAPAAFGTPKGIADIPGYDDHNAPQVYRLGTDRTRMELHIRGTWREAVGIGQEWNKPLRIRRPRRSYEMGRGRDVHCQLGKLIADRVQRAGNFVGEPLPADGAVSLSQKNIGSAQIATKCDVSSLAAPAPRESLPLPIGDD